MANGRQPNNTLVIPEQYLGIIGVGTLFNRCARDLLRAIEGKLRTPEEFFKAKIPKSENSNKISENRKIRKSENSGKISENQKIRKFEKSRKYLKPENLKIRKFRKISGNPKIWTQKFPPARSPAPSRRGVGRARARPLARSSVRPPARPLARPSSDERACPTIVTHVFWSLGMSYDHGTCPMITRHVLWCEDKSYDHNTCLVIKPNR